VRHALLLVDPLDRRRVIVRPTPTGRELWRRHLHEGIEREKAAFAPLSAAELKQLNALLRKVVARIEGQG
jgi:DNA-binding MarR family transcriptional regulator